MRLLLISPGYPPTPSAGGVETHVHGLAENLVEHVEHVEVWAPERGARHVTVEEQNGVTVRRFPSNHSTRFQLAPALYARARRELGTFDLVHAHSFHNAAAAAVLLGGTGTRFVFTPHYHGAGHTRLADLAHRPYRPIGRRLFDRAGAVVAVSQAEAVGIRADHPRIAPHVVHNAADTVEIAQAEPYADQPPTAMVLGRIEPYKRIDLVLDAFDQLEGPAQLIITGDGPGRPELEQRVRTLRRRDDVRVLGRIERPALHRWLRTARTVVSMSEREAFGLVAIEASAAGATAILSDLPAHREVQGLVPGRATIVRPDELREVLAARLAEPNAGPGTGRTWGDVAQALTGIYDEVLATG